MFFNAAQVRGQSVGKLHDLLCNHILERAHTFKHLICIHKCVVPLVKYLD